MNRSLVAFVALQTKQQVDLYDNLGSQKKIRKTCKLEYQVSSCEFY